MTELPAEVEFANWMKYQHTNATHYAKVETSLLYDTRTRVSDGARGRLLTGVLLAVMGRGRINVRAWIKQCTNESGARRNIKAWLDNGLLKTVPVQIDREIERETEKHSAAVAPAGPAVPAKANGRRPETSWQAPYCAAWEAVCGAKSWRAVAGQCANYVKPLHEEHGPDVVVANLKRYLAGSSPEFRSLQRFAAGFAQWSAPDATRATEQAIAESIRKKLGKHGGPVTAPANFFAAELDENEQAVWRKLGGVGPIWSGAPQREMH